MNSIFMSLRENDNYVAYGYTLCTFHIEDEMISLWRMWYVIRRYNVEELIVKP